MQLIYWGTAWFVGIWLATQLAWRSGHWLGLAVVGLLSMLLLRQRPSWQLLFLCILGLALGGWRQQTAVPHIDESHIAFYNGARSLTFTGLVSDEPDIRDRFVNLRVTTETLTLEDGREIPVQGTVLVRAFRFPVIPYGTRLRLTGRLQTPPEGEDFNYRDYLARQGIHSMLSLPDFEILAENVGNPLYHAIFAVKERAKGAIRRLIPEPHAALLTGILLGDDNGLPPELADAFRLTGMTHIIAISGFNISLLIAILFSLSRPFLSQRGAVLFAVGGISLYTILVGADASVVRAALMGGIYLLTNRLMGRPNFAVASLFLAGIVMTAVNPFTLWDAGFQLSFAATLSLMLYATPFTEWTEERLQRWLTTDLVQKVMSVLNEAVIITLAAQILTLPLLVAYFQQLSLISLPANAFILPAQPGVMLWGGLATARRA